MKCSIFLLGRLDYSLRYAYSVAPVYSMHYFFLPQLSCMTSHEDLYIARLYRFEIDQTAEAEISPGFSIDVYDQCFLYFEY